VLLTYEIAVVLSAASIYGCKLLKSGTMTPAGVKRLLLPVANTVVNTLEEQKLAVAGAGNE